MLNFDGPVIRAIKERFPIGGAVIETMGPRIIDEIRRQPAGRPMAEVVEAVAPAIEQIARQNPEIKNNLNLEKPVQSRVVVGSTIALIASLFTAIAQLLGMFQDFDLTTFDFAMAGALLGAIWGSGYALYGRLASGLKPLFSRRKSGAG